MRLSPRVDTRFERLERLQEKLDMRRAQLRVAEGDIVTARAALGRAEWRRNAIDSDISAIMREMEALDGK